MHFHTFKSNDAQDEVVATARDWAEVIFGRREPTHLQRARFAKWLGDVAHERALSEELQIRLRLGEISETAKEELCADVARRNSRRYLPSLGQWTSPRWVAAAAVALLAFGAGWVWLSDKHYRTNVGEKLATHLIDGTSVELSTQTELRWLGYGLCDRRVKLIRGEALFNVHSDARCPFKVLLGNGSVEVLGTQFDVHQDGQGEERVAVLEGRVRIHGPAGTPPWQVDLGAGQQAVWRTGVPRTRRLDDISRVAAWREDRLDFDNEPLGQVVNELQRYTSVPIRIADQSLLSTHVSGGGLQVDETHIRDSVRSLGQLPGIEVQDDGRAWILARRASK